MLNLLLAASLTLVGLAQADLAAMRGTMPGSLHQCDQIPFVFFDTQDTGAKTVLLVSQADSSKLGAGTIALGDALAAVTPLQQITGIKTADAASTMVTLQIASGQSFATFGFLSNGQGKNLNLNRNVQQALPGAASCLNGNAPAAPAAAVVTPTTTSGFVTSVRPASSALPVEQPSTSTVVVTVVPTTTAPVAVAAAPPANTVASSSSSAAQASPSTVVVDTQYLLTSFINIAADKATDGKISARQIEGGSVTGKVNGTILPFGSALFRPNVTTVNGTATTSSNSSLLLSASFSFQTTDNSVVFAMAQTPLSKNFTTDALLMEFTATGSNASIFSNLTILGKAQTVNATLLRIDAYYVTSS